MSYPWFIIFFAFFCCLKAFGIAALDICIGFCNIRATSALPAALRITGVLNQVFEFPSVCQFVSRFHLSHQLSFTTPVPLVHLLFKAVWPTLFCPFTAMLKSVCDLTPFSLFLFSVRLSRHLCLCSSMLGDFISPICASSELLVLVVLLSSWFLFVSFFSFRTRFHIRHANVLQQAV